MGGRRGGENTRLVIRGTLDSPGASVETLVTLGSSKDSRRLPPRQQRPRPAHYARPSPQQPASHLTIFLSYKGNNIWVVVALQVVVALEDQEWEKQL
jgi:hypothetical protein